MNENLKPIRPGQTGANHPRSKPVSEHRSKVVAVRVTADEMKRVSAKAKAGGLSITKWARSRLGLD